MHELEGRWQPKGKVKVNLLLIISLPNPLDIIKRYLTEGMKHR